MNKTFLIIGISLLFLTPIFSNSQSISLVTNNQSIENLKDSCENYNYIILTNDFIKNSIKELVNWREIQGFRVNIITNLNDPEEIREFLKSKYIDWGIEYVLIVGSHKIIPMKIFQYDNHSIPTDHYYAELFNDWDNIENNSDLIPQLSVGRIPLDNPIKIKRFCRKIINYEQDIGDWKKKALFLTGIQEYKENFIDNAQLSEIMVNELFLVNNYNCTKLYETKGLKPSNFSYDLPLNYINTIRKWREGYGFVSIMVRGRPRGAMRYIWVKDANDDGIRDENDIFRITGKPIMNSFAKFFLTDNKPSVVYSFTCFTAKNKLFSLCSSLLDSTAVVFIGPAYGNIGGWQLKYNFTKYYTSTNMRLGDAFRIAQEEYINSNGGIDNKYIPNYLKEYGTNISIRWTIINTGFYGDPATIKYLT